MRTWAQWCVKHNLKVLLYIIMIFVQLPISLTVFIGRAIVETYEDLLDNLKSIHKAKETNG